MTNVVVTGADGQVGSLIRVKANAYPFKICALNREALDITSPQSILDAIDKYKPRLIINCAAYTAVEQAEKNKRQALHVNDYAVQLLGKACLQADIPLFHISTDYVFDGAKRDPYNEEDEAVPQNSYGASKLAGEKSLQQILERHLIIRTSWVFSEIGNNFVKTMLRLSAQNNRIKVVSDQISAPTSAHSLAEILLTLAHKFIQEGELKWGVYHYANYPYCSWFDFAKEIFDQATKKNLIAVEPTVDPVSSEQFASLVKRPQFSRLDCGKIDNYISGCLRDWRIELSNVLDATAE